MEVHTAEPLVPGPSRLEAEIPIAGLKKYNSPGSDQIPSELIQAGGELLQPAIHKLINSIWNKEEFPVQWKESLIVPDHKKGDKTDCNNYRGISLLSTSYNILSNILLLRSESFPIRNGLKQGDALPQLLFNFSLEYAIRKVHETHVGL
jgi:hypothetical protein